MRPQRLLLVLAAAALACAAPAWACNVPVFRYALERWKPDVYEAVLFHEGPLPPELEELVGMLRRADERGGGLANLRVTTVDLKGPVAGDLRALWEEQEGAIAPWLVVRYPAALRVDAVLWSSKADRQNVDALLRSPARDELARRLLSGQSVVWLLIESGDPARDQNVASVLDRKLKMLEGTIKLPDELVSPGGVLQVSAEEEGLLSNVPLRVEFSILRVARADFAERGLLATILRTDEGLAGETGPIVLPVFGRGRALRAFPGEALDTESITDVVEFLCGACSCSVKSLNPGMDLLLDANWESILHRRDAAASPDASQTRPPGVTLVPIPVGARPDRVPDNATMSAASPGPIPAASESRWRVLYAAAAGIGIVLLTALAAILRGGREAIRRG